VAKDTGGVWTAEEDAFLLQFVTSNPNSADCACGI
jgi:hypothetical protein